jgi:hypothetical protein
MDKNKMYLLEILPKTASDDRWERKFRSMDRQMAFDEIEAYLETARAIRIRLEQTGNLVCHVNTAFAFGPNCAMILLPASCLPVSDKH